MTLKAKVSSARALQHQAFINALGDAVIEHSDIFMRPLDISINKPFPLDLRVYLFTCSNPHGGRSADEYKFNLNVPFQEGRGNFDQSDNRFIILSAVVIKDDPEDNVFVIFDATMHKDFCMNANVQTKSSVIYDAMLSKIATYDKNNGERVIAARGKYLIDAIKMRSDLDCLRFIGE